MSIVRTKAPAVEPVTLAEAKAHLRVDYNDEDALIGGLIAAAVSHFDGLGVLGRAMITQTWAQSFQYTRAWERLDIGPFQSLLSVEYYDAGNVLQTADLADFETRLDGDHVIVGPKINAAWPSIYNRPDAVKVTYVAGYGDTPEDIPASIRHAILLTLAHWYENREAVAEGSFNELPLAVASLIGVERVGWYG